MRRLGILGTLVWDRIFHRDPARSGPVEEWGGVAYALSAFEAAGPPGWSAVPMIKIGRDVREEAVIYLRSLERLASTGGILWVDEPNNRVDLHYRDRERRCERLSGGVPGWTWAELEPLVRSCDAMYVNFIAGWEVELETARRLRDACPGPVYADLHSLFLGVGPDGVRTLRPLQRGREWVRAFDFVQMNEDELDALAAASDPWRLAAETVGEATLALFVTLGVRGAAWFAAPGFRGLEGTGPRVAVRDGEGPVRSGREAPERLVEDGDPTGCGDAWGVACFGALLEGRDVPEAVARANRVAARNAEFRGATALARAVGESGRLLRPDPP